MAAAGGGDDYAGTRGRRRGACTRTHSGHFRFSQVRVRRPTAPHPSGSISTLTTTGSRAVNRPAVVAISTGPHDTCSRNRDRVLRAAVTAALRAASFGDDDDLSSR